MQQYDAIEIFCCYARKDAKFMEELKKHLSSLQRQNLIDVWYDGEIRAGTEWDQEIKTHLNKAQIILLLISPDFIDSSYSYDIEIKRALERHEQKEARVISVVLRPLGNWRDIPIGKTKLGQLQTLPKNIQPVSTWQNRDVAWQDVTEEIGKIANELLGKSSVSLPSAPPESTLPDEPSPYPSLLSFTAQQVRFFFGRTNESQRLLERVQLYPFTSVIGASGSGKSSLIQAGLLPILKPSWDVLSLAPGSQPLRALSDQLSVFMPIEARLRVSDELEQQLLSRSDGLSRATSTLLINRPDFVTLLLFVDQFEELFTQISGTLDEVRQVQRAFIMNLMNAAKNSKGKVRVIITLRADFLRQCLEFADLRILLESNQLLLGPMNEAALREAILKPAQAVGAVFEKGLVERLMKDMRGQPAALPLLQATLAQLWQKRQGIWLTHAAYEEIGGVSGAINQRADAIYDQLSIPDQQLARKLFVRLVTLGDGTSDTRRRMRHSELSFIGVTNQEVNHLIDTLSDHNARLIATDADTVELVHEALIEQWEKLRDWLEEDRSALRLHQRLIETAYEWEAHERDESYLYSGARLLQALEWSKIHGEEMNALERTFLEMSQEHAKARAAAAETTRLLQEQLLAEEPVARAGESIFELERKPERALLLALAATRTSRTAHSPIVTRALYYALDNSRIRKILRGHVDRISAVAWSPDGCLVLTGSYDNTARIWDVAIGETIKVLVGHTDSVTSVAWSPDGKQVLTGSWDGTARLWDVTGGKTVTIFAGHKSWVSSVSWSQDGSMVATGSRDMTACLWDITGKTIHILEGHKEWVRSAEWSPDGQYVLTGSYDGTARLWDIATGKHLRTLKAHTQAVPSVAWSPDGKRALTASEDGTVRIWNVANWKTVHIIHVHTSHIYVGVWSPDGQRVLTGSEDAKVRVWDVETGTKLLTLAGHTGWVSSVAWSPDGRQVIGGSEDMTARIWDMEMGAKMSSLNHTTSVHSVAWSPDGRYVLTATVEDWIARIWDAKKQELMRELYPAKAFSVMWSPDGLLIAIGGWDGIIYILETTAGILLFTLSGHTDAIHTVAWGPDKQYLLTGSRDGTARVWDLETKTNRYVLPHSSWVEAATWSPDGSRILTADFERTARIWDAATGTEIRALTGHTTGLHSVSWSPDGKQVVTTSGDGTARIWDAATGTGLHILYAGEAHSVAWSPHEQQILTGSQDGTARIWDAATGTEIRTLSHAGAVYSVAWSLDGHYILIGNEDNNAYIWAASRFLITAEVIRRICTLFSDEEICKEIRNWRGKDIEMAEVAESLKIYDS